ncbi:MAG: hypothetical protein ACKN9T_03720, partial [Candidatus Methylumidiphilus sp.]
MKNHHFFSLRHNARVSDNPPQHTSRPRAVSAAVWAAVSLGLAVPAGAATVTINTPTTSTLLLNSGNALDVTATGRIEPVSGVAVANASNGVTLDGISNAGLIGSADSDAIALGANVTVNGDIRNSGTVKAASDGLFIDSQSVVTGSIINEASGIINGGQVNPQDGIELQDSSTVNADIINHGTINAAVDGIQLSWNSRVEGDIVNNGTIDVGQDGIDLTAG